MPSHHRNGLRAVALAAAVLFVASGCTEGAAVASNTAGATVRPAATVRPTPSPTRPASPSPSPKPSASPEEVAARAVDSLKIGKPYALVFNAANPALSANFSFQVGSVTVTETMSGLEIRQRGQTVGLVYVLEIVGIPMNNAAFEGGARGAAANTGGKLTYAKVLGKKVAYIAARQASFAMYLHGATIVMVGAQTLGLTKTLLASVIKSNR
ncbi:MAG TPA: hypothetical protein VID95_03910 [Candidatus Limnocylindrales bacterium]|jgi:hypothetical protein